MLGVETEIRGGLPGDVTPGLSTSLRVKVCPEDTEEGEKTTFPEEGTECSLTEVERTSCMRRHAGWSLSSQRAWRRGGWKVGRSQIIPPYGKLLGDLKEVRDIS